MAPKLTANDNCIAEIGDRLTPFESKIVRAFRRLSAPEKALMIQQFQQIVPLPGDTRAGK